MKEIIERLNNLMAVLEESEEKAEGLEIAKVITELAQLDEAIARLEAIANKKEMKNGKNQKEL